MCAGRRAELIWERRFALAANEALEPFRRRGQVFERDRAQLLIVKRQYLLEQGGGRGVNEPQLLLLGACQRDVQR